jgi:hypothetical protein
MAYTSFSLYERSEDVHGHWTGKHPRDSQCNPGSFRAAVRSRGTGSRPVPRDRPDRPSSYHELAWRFPGQHTRSPTMAPSAVRRESAGTSARAASPVLRCFPGSVSFTGFSPRIHQCAVLFGATHTWTYPGTHGQVRLTICGVEKAMHIIATRPTPISHSLFCTWCTRDACRWRIDRQFGHRLHIYNPASCELTQLHFRASVLHARPTGPRQRSPQNQDRERAHVFLLAWLTFCGRPVAPSPQVVLSGSGRESQSCFPYFSGLEKSLSVRR